MTFWNQLKLLLWKNYCIRKRQKVRLAIEIIWPLVLFLILAWVRTRGLKNYNPECHFEEKALPSAGLMPFFRSFICTFNNSCHMQIMSADAGSSTAANNFSMITNLADDLESVLSDRVHYEHLAHFRLVQDDIKTLQTLTAMLQSPDNNDFTGNLSIGAVISQQFVESQPPGVYRNLTQYLLDENLSISLSGLRKSMVEIIPAEVNPRNLICNDTIFFVLVPADAEQKKEISDLLEKICHSKFNAEFLNFAVNLVENMNFTRFLDELSELTESELNAPLSVDSWPIVDTVLKNIFRDMRHANSTRTIFSNVKNEMSELALLMAGKKSWKESLSKFLCGSEKFYDQLFDADERLKIEDFRKRFRQRKKVHFFDNDSDSTSHECSVLFHSLSESEGTTFLWQQLKPFVVGKILYTPNTPVTNRIMSNVNDSFSGVGDILTLLDNWNSNISPGLRNYLLNRTETLQFWQNITNPKILKENPWIGTILHRWIGSRLWGIRDIEDVIIESEMGKLHKFFTNDAFELWKSGLDQMDSAVQTALKYLKCFEMNKVQAWDDEKSAVREATRLIGNNRLWALVVFTDLETNNNESFPSFIRYKIRMDSDKVDSTKHVEDRVQRPGPRRRPGIDLKYYNFGFTFIQDLVEHSIISEQSESGDSRMLPGMWLQQFPYPCYIHDQFIMAISRSFPMFMTLAWVYTSAMIIKTVVQEKERRLKEFMKSMGLTSGVHWDGWFINSFIMMLFTIVLLTIVLKVGKVLENSDPTVIFAFLLCYTLATITKSFALSTLFSQANIAAAAGGIIFFVLYLPYAFLVLWEEQLQGYVKTATSLISNVAFGFGCSYFAQFEEMGVGLQWNNIWLSSLPNDTFNMASCMLMLQLDSFIYLFIMWYIENVFPGEYGSPRPWYFPFTIAYWCQYRSWHNQKNSYSNGILMSETGHNVDFEMESNLYSNLGVSIKNLRKVYSNGKVAVEDLSLNFYEDQITSFLGHNGAGKTTTISILTGMIPATSGDASIYGSSISSDMENIRTNLGTCPQHNVLFDELTVEEHLWFYASLKGVSSKKVKAEVTQMLVDLGLLEKRQNMISALSGGMQRKLSVAVAFVGGSRTVILDEPTAGVDPYSRRSIWELLLKYKQGRTIILTTHHMDEADLLGDRIAIIARGRLRCCGSSLFLKSRFGQGYYLTMVKDSKWSSDIDIIDESHSPGIDKEAEVTKVIKSVIPGAKLLENLGAELCYVLPNNAKISGAFGQLFNKLDSHMKDLHIVSYGISDTTLEEIFLRVAEGNAPETASQNGNVIAMETFTEGGRIPAPPRSGRQRIASCTKVSPLLSKKQNSNGFISSPTTRIIGGKLVIRHISALLVKRFHHSRRNVKGIVCEIILPALFVCLALASTLTLPPLQEEPPLELTPWIYGPPNYIFFSNANPRDETTLQYEKMLTTTPYLGTRCMNGDPVVGKECEKSATTPEWVYSKETQSKEQVQCSCKTGTSVCPSGAGGPLGPNIHLPTSDILVDMTNRNISDWLVKTQQNFYNQRYGGVTFGIRNPTSSINISAIRNTWERLSKAANAGQPPANESLEFFTQLDTNLKQLQIFDNIKIWYNNRGWASSVSYLNAINNIVLRSHLGPNQDPRRYGISVTNHPINFTEEQLQEEVMRLSGVSLLHSVCVIFAMSFVPASFVMHLIEERVSKSKHLQIVSGVRPVTYWVAHYIWDMMNYMVSATLCIFIFLAFNEDAYVSPENLPGLILLLTCYGFASIPMMYPFAYLFRIPSTAFVTLSCGNLFVGIVSTVATFILEVMEDEELKAIAAILKEVFLVFPHYCMGRGLMDLATNHIAAKSFRHLGIDVYQEPLKWSFLGRNLVFMLVQAVVFFTLTLLIQYRIWNKIVKKETIVGDVVHLTSVEDDDVLKERQRVLSGNAGNCMLKIQNLSKFYKIQGGKLCAVDRLCVGVEAGECFGLLGVNGAGKTTTFRMLTGDVSITSGDAFINGVSILTSPSDAQRCMGYCPQFDAIDPLLTAEEHLLFYARLRGIPEKYVAEEMRTNIARLNLSECAKRRSGTYSGGNKRRLSTAIALIGDPKLIFMDEPTTGMDPKARRYLWASIGDVVKQGRSVVFTSHSMEECEALCTRLAIMVNGRFQCIGSTQHLKTKFGDGYTVTLRVGGSPSDVEKAIASMEREFPDATLKEIHHNQLMFQFPSKHLSLARLFDHMELAKQQFGVDDYSLSQTTLDQVFINFAKLQTNARESKV